MPLDCLDISRLWETGTGMSALDIRGGSTMTVPAGSNGSMRHFRRIVVDGIEYIWLFRYEDFKYTKNPYLLVGMPSQPKAWVRMVFELGDHFMLNSGYPALFSGEEVLVNMNQPSMIAKAIRQCRKMGINFEGTGEIVLDGVDVLEEMGYSMKKDIGPTAVGR